MLLRARQESRKRLTTADAATYQQAGVGVLPVGRLTVERRA